MTHQITHTTQVAIIGGGLAAHTAARVVHQAGARALMIYPPSPGASALWSGLGQTFGPASEFPSRSVGLFGSRAELPHALRTRRATRFLALTHRRQFHPYQRVGLDFDALDDTLNHAVNTLDYPGLRAIKPELILPSPAATPFPADLAAPSVVASAIGAGERVGVVACPSLVDWFPERLVDVIEDIAAGAGSDSGANSEKNDASRISKMSAIRLDVDIFNEIQGGPRRLHSAIIAAELEKKLATQPEQLSQSILAALDRAGLGSQDLDLLILPPCIGRTWQAHQRLMTELNDTLPFRIAEAAAARNSIHGWRLDRYLRAQNPLEVISGRALKIDYQKPAHYLVHTVPGTVQADAVIVATGRWVGSGLPASAPFREELLGVDVWLDGAPIARPDYQWGPELLAAQPWQDHPLFRAGLATDAALRPLDPNGIPLAPGIFAAGRLLAGFNPFWDGTTEGVDLVTGLLAAQKALATLGLRTDASHLPLQNNSGQPAQNSTGHAPAPGGAP